MVMDLSIFKIPEHEAIVLNMAFSLKNLTTPSVSYVLSITFVMAKITFNIGVYPNVIVKGGNDISRDHTNHSLSTFFLNDHAIGLVKVR